MRKRSLFIVGGIVATVLVLGGVVWAAIFLLHSSAGTSPPTAQDQLPPLADQAVPTASHDQPSDVPAPSLSATPTNSAIVAPTTGRRLAVTVTYRRDPQFTLSISATAATNMQPTIQYYRPMDGESFSLIRVFDPTGKMLVEEPFRITTSVNLESPDGSPTSYALPDSSVFLVLDLPDGAQPAKVQIVSQQGAVLDEQATTVTITKPTASLLDRMRNWFVAHAQGASRFTIVVINEVGAQSVLPAAAAATQATLALEPWKTYADRIDIVPIYNDESLGCTSITLPNGSPYPVCPNSAQIFQAIALSNPNLQPNAVVVTTTFDCDCGTVVNEPIVAVGKKVDQRLIIHEFGHAVGGMVDEYYYLSGVTSGPLDSNCFASQSSCQAAIVPFPGAQCSLGCRTTTSWRPANQIMDNIYSPLAYGPLEECILRKKIAAALGESVQCGATPTPSPTPQKLGTYWGWIAP